MKRPRSAPPELRTGAFLVCGMFSKPSPAPACGDTAGGSWASPSGGVPCLSWTWLLGALVPVAVPRRSGTGGACLWGCGDSSAAGLSHTDCSTLGCVGLAVVRISYPLSLVRALRELRATVGQLGFRCWARHIFPTQHRPQLLEALLAQAVLHVAALLRRDIRRNTGFL